MPEMAIQARPSLLAQDQETAGAAELWAALLRLPSSEARYAALKEPRFHQAALGRLLLAEAIEALPGVPARAEALARQALLVAEHLPATAPGTLRLRAEAACRLAQACSTLGNGEGAEQSLLLAVRFLEAPLSSPERAVFCQTRALFRKLEGRIDEAISLYQRALALFREHRGPGSREAALCELSLGVLWLEADDPRSALPLLARSQDALGAGWAHSPWYAQGHFAGWLCRLRLTEPHDESVEAAVAQELRSISLDYVGGCPDAAWWAGRLALYLDDLDTAEPFLDRARRGYLARRNVIGSALATLGSLAARPERVEVLLSGLDQPCFRRSPRRRHVIEALRAFARHASGPHRRLALEAAERHLRRLQFSPRHSSPYLARASAAGTRATAGDGLGSATFSMETPL